jgi:hypothetical protein
VVLAVTTVLMTNLAAVPMAGYRWQLGAQNTRNPRQLEAKFGPPGQGTANLAALQASWHPWRIAVIGLIGLALLLWLMYQKPF